MSLTYEITVNGDLSEDEMEARLQVLAELILQDVKAKIRDFSLIETSDYLQGWTASVDGNTLTFDNTEEYPLYLEYGTLEYADRYEGTWPDPRHPKKKNISQRRANQLPKGMQPFAPFRRTVYNPRLMEENIKQAYRGYDVEVGTT